MNLSKVVDNVFKFFWNRWNLQTAKEIFGDDLGEHLFYKSTYIDELWSYMDDNCKKKLTEFANNYYK